MLVTVTVSVDYCLTLSTTRPPSQILEYKRVDDPASSARSEDDASGVKEHAARDVAHSFHETQTACAVPTWPLSSPTLPPESISSLSLHGYIITIPPLRQCVATFVRIRPPPSQRTTDWLSVNVDAAPIRAYLHVFTKMDGSGAPCEPGDPPDRCSSVSRALPLLVARDRNAYSLKIVPDTSSSHYILQFQVGCSCSVQFYSESVRVALVFCNNWSPAPGWW
jgi:hypothetical protein